MLFKANKYNFVSAILTINFYLRLMTKTWIANGARGIKITAYRCINLTALPHATGNSGQKQLVIYAGNCMKSLTMGSQVHLPSQMYSRLRLSSLMWTCINLTGIRVVHINRCHELNVRSVCRLNTALNSTLHGTQKDSWTVQNGEINQ